MKRKWNERDGLNNRNPGKFIVENEWYGSAFIPISTFLFIQSVNKCIFYTKEMREWKILENKNPVNNNLTDALNTTKKNIPIRFL